MTRNVRSLTLPLVCVASAAVLGTLYERYVGNWAHHAGPGWWLFGDLYYIVWAAWTTNQHGGLTHVYEGWGQVEIAFPGFIYILAALNLLLSHVGLGIWLSTASGHGTIESATISGPAWWVIAPFCTLLGCSAVVPVDALARRQGVSGAQRIVLCVATAGALGWLSVMFGHPDDGLAFACLLGATVMALDRRWKGAAWLLGVGLAVQPLILLAVPVLIVMAGYRQSLRLAPRVLLFPAVTIAIPAYGTPRVVWYRLSKQPNFTIPPTNHATPWMSLSQHINAHAVSAGPIRLVLIALVTFLAVFVLYRAGLVPSLRTLGVDQGSKLALPYIAWVIGIDFDLRGATEPVLIPYYLVPGFVAGFLACAMRSDRTTRPLVAIGVAGVTAWVSELHSIGEYPYLILVVIGLAALAALSAPQGALRRSPAQASERAPGGPVPAVAAVG